MHTTRIGGLRYWLVALLVMLATMTAAAQEVALPNTYTFPSGTTFGYPDDWGLGTEATETIASVANETTVAEFVDFAAIADAGFLAGDGLDTFVAWYLIQATDGAMRYDPQQGIKVEIGGRAALRYAYRDAFGVKNLMIGIVFSDGTAGIMSATAQGSSLADEDVLLAMVASFDHAADGTGGSSVALTGGLPGSSTSGGANTPISIPSTPCTVSVSQANSARVRVGPGENRTSYVFLPPNQEFTVLGQASANDNSLWWQLDKDEVAPTAAAAEAWVAQTDVRESGDCAAVVDADAPPIIPIISAPPPPPSGGDTGGGGDSPPITGSINPAQGVWRMTFAASAPGSCAGTGTVNVPINLPAENFRLSGSGQTIIFGGEALTLVSPNTYRGLFDMSDLFVGGSAQIFLDVASRTTMGARIIYTGSFEDTQCSVTIPATVTFLG